MSVRLLPTTTSPLPRQRGRDRVGGDGWGEVGQTQNTEPMVPPPSPPSPIEGEGVWPWRSDRQAHTKVPRARSSKREIPLAIEGEKAAFAHSSKREIPCPSMGGGSALAWTVSAVAIGGVPLADCAIADFPLGTTALTSCPPRRPLSRASGGGTGWGVMAGVRWGRRKTPSRWFHPHPRLPPSRGKELSHGGATVRPTPRSHEPAARSVKSPSPRGREGRLRPLLEE